MVTEYFICPVNEKYAYCTEEEKRVKTEKTFEVLKEYYEKIEAVESDYINRINSVLNTGAGAKEALAILGDTMGQMICYYRYRFHLFEILCHIAKQEEECGESVVFRNFHTMDEAYEWIQRRIFELRRVELGWEEDSYGKLLNLLKNNEISYICLAQLIGKCEIIRKLETADRMAKYMYKHGMGKKAVSFLMWLDDMLPYSEEKIMTFTMTLLEMNERRLAYKEILKFREPNEEIKEMQNVLKGML